MSSIQKATLTSSKNTRTTQHNHKSKCVGNLEAEPLQNKESERKVPGPIYATARTPHLASTVCVTHDSVYLQARLSASSSPFFCHTLANGLRFPAGGPRFLDTVAAAILLGQSLVKRAYCRLRNLALAHVADMAQRIGLALVWHAAGFPAEHLAVDSLGWHMQLSFTPAWPWGTSGALKKLAHKLPLWAHP